jgi:SAM-dependent methyltransferase
MATEPPRAVESRTRTWLAGRFRTGFDAHLPDRAPLYDALGHPQRMSAYQFWKLARKLKIFRWLDRLEFSSFLDVASGWEHLPYLVGQRYGVPAYYSDFVHELNLPFDAPVFGKRDHAVTLKLPVLPFKDQAFDVVLCSEVFEHLVRPVEAIAELVRITRKCLILTTLEGLCSSPLKRRLLHHRVDVRVPHVERNFLLLEEFRGLLEPGFHHESLHCDLRAPAGMLEPPEVQQAKYGAITDSASLAAALVRAVSEDRHGASSMGILAAKVTPGTALRAPRPGGDHELARWLVEQEVAEERHTQAALAAAAAIERDPQLLPPELVPFWPVAPTLLTLLRCPDCAATLESLGFGVRCRGCGQDFPGDGGVPILYPTREAATPTEDICLDRLCGDDESRRRTVRRLMRRLRRNEHPPGLLRRVAWRLGPYRRSVAAIALVRRLIRDPDARSSERT